MMSSEGGYSAFEHRRRAFKSVSQAISSRSERFARTQGTRCLQRVTRQMEWRVRHWARAALLNGLAGHSTGTDVIDVAEGDYIDEDDGLVADAGAAKIGDPGAGDDLATHACVFTARYRSALQMSVASIVHAVAEHLSRLKLEQAGVDVLLETGGGHAVWTALHTGLAALDTDLRVSVTRLHSDGTDHTTLATPVLHDDVAAFDMAIVCVRLMDMACNVLTTFGVANSARGVGDSDACYLQADAAAMCRIIDQIIGCVKRSMRAVLCLRGMCSPAPMATTTELVQRVLGILSCRILHITSTMIGTGMCMVYTLGDEQVFAVGTTPLPAQVYPLLQWTIAVTWETLDELLDCMKTQVSLTPDAGVSTTSAAAPCVVDTSWNLDAWLTAEHKDSIGASFAMASNVAAALCSHALVGVRRVVVEAIVPRLAANLLQDANLSRTCARRCVAQLLPIALAVGGDRARYRALAHEQYGMLRHGQSGDCTASASNSVSVYMMRMEVCQLLSCVLWQRWQALRTAQCEAPDCRTAAASSTASDDAYVHAVKTRPEGEACSVNDLLTILREEGLFRYAVAALAYDCGGNHAGGRGMVQYALDVTSTCAVHAAHPDKARQPDDLKERAQWKSEILLLINMVLAVDMNAHSNETASAHGSSCHTALQACVAVQLFPTLAACIGGMDWYEAAADYGVSYDGVFSVSSTPGRSARGCMPATCGGHVAAHDARSYAMGPGAIVDSAEDEEWGWNSDDDDTYIVANGSRARIDTATTHKVKRESVVSNKPCPFLHAILHVCMSLVLHPAGGFLAVCSSPCIVQALADIAQKHPRTHTAREAVLCIVRIIAAAEAAAEVDTTANATGTGEGVRSTAEAGESTFHATSSPSSAEPSEHGRRLRERYAQALVRMNVAEALVLGCLRLTRVYHEGLDENTVVGASTDQADETSSAVRRAVTLEQTLTGAIHALRWLCAYSWEAFGRVDTCNMLSLLCRLKEAFAKEHVMLLDACVDFELAYY